MKYKNLIIKCNNEEEFKKLQKHLFYYKYSWIDNNIRNHIILNIKKFAFFGSQKINQIYVVIRNDDILQWDYRENIILALLEESNLFNYKLINYTAFERSLKIKKIKNETKNYFSK
jgi:hypothetical protein